LILFFQAQVHAQGASGKVVFMYVEEKIIFKIHFCHLFPSNTHKNNSYQVTNSSIAMYKKFNFVLWQDSNPRSSNPVAVAMTIAPRHHPWQKNDLVSRSQIITFS
jgi:hypothetical protein